MSRITYGLCGASSLLAAQLIGLYITRVSHEERVNESLKNKNVGGCTHVPTSNSYLSALKPNNIKPVDASVAICKGNLGRTPVFRFEGGAQWYYVGTTDDLRDASAKEHIVKNNFRTCFLSRFFDLDKNHKIREHLITAPVADVPSCNSFENAIWKDIIRNKRDIQKTFTEELPIFEKQENGDFVFLGRLYQLSYETRERLSEKESLKKLKVGNFHNDHLYFSDTVVGHEASLVRHHKDYLQLVKNERKFETEVQRALSKMS